AQLIANPQNFYVNVHTSAFPGGAIRGQLAAVSGTIINYAADLKSANEVPPTGSSAFGSAFVTIGTPADTRTWGINTSGIASPTAAHIHGPGGTAGINKGVLIGFATNASQIPGGRTKGSVSLASLDAGTLNLLLTDPSQFYVNVHSTAFGGGEIRGQL